MRARVGGSVHSNIVRKKQSVPTYLLGTHANVMTCTKETQLIELFEAN